MDALISELDQGCFTLLGPENLQGFIAATQWFSAFGISLALQAFTFTLAQAVKGCKGVTIPGDVCTVEMWLWRTWWRWVQVGLGVLRDLFQPFWFSVMSHVLRSPNPTSENKNISRITYAPKLWFVLLWWRYRKEKLLIINLKQGTVKSNGELILCTAFAPFTADRSVRGRLSATCFTCSLPHAGLLQHTPLSTTQLLWSPPADVAQFTPHFNLGEAVVTQHHPALTFWVGTAKAGCSLCSWSTKTWLVAPGPLLIWLLCEYVYNIYINSKFI